MPQSRWPPRSWTEFEIGGSACWRSVRVIIQFNELEGVHTLEQFVLPVPVVLVLMCQLPVPAGQAVDIGDYELGAAIAMDMGDDGMVNMILSKAGIRTNYQKQGFIDAAQQRDPRGKSKFSR